MKSDAGRQVQRGTQKADSSLCQDVVNHISYQTYALQIEVVALVTSELIPKWREGLTITSFSPNNIHENGIFGLCLWQLRSLSGSKEFAILVPVAMQENTKNIFIKA